MWPQVGCLTCLAVVLDSETLGSLAYTRMEVPKIWARWLRKWLKRLTFLIGLTLYSDMEACKNSIYEMGPNPFSSSYSSEKRGKKS